MLTDTTGVLETHDGTREYVRVCMCARRVFVQDKPDDRVRPERIFAIFSPLESQRLYTYYVCSSEATFARGENCDPISVAVPSAFRQNGRFLMKPFCTSKAVKCGNNFGPAGRSGQAGRQELSRREKGLFKDS